jgi:hypothetical protein
LFATGFAPKKSVNIAIKEIIAAFNAGKLKSETRFHNLKWMQENKLA